MPLAATPADVQQSLAQLERRHESRVAALKQQSEQQFRVATKAGNAATTALVAGVNRDCAELHQGAKRVDGELKELMKQTEQMHKRTQQWAAMMLKFNGALKELGDVANWSRMIERDVEDTVTVLDAIAATKRRAAGLPADDRSPDASASS